MVKAHSPRKASTHNGPQIDLGILPTKRKAIAEGLSTVLTDTDTLYLKTHNFPWNVTGSRFQTLHLMFEQQYNEPALAGDPVAERMRALGHPAPGRYAQFSKRSSITEATGVIKAEDMIHQLVEGQETLARTARNVFATAEKTSDQVTIDLLTYRIQGHEKTAWMRRSVLE